MYRILIVEDDEKLRQELKIFLEKNGYEVVILEEFENAVEDIVKTGSDLSLIHISEPTRP